MPCEYRRKHCPPPVPERGLIGPRLGRAARITKHNFNMAVSEEGLFSGQHHIIMLLTEKNYMTVSEIAQELGVAYSTVSVSIKRMEKSGLISKKPDKNDARITHIYLTEKGKSIPEHIKQKMDSQEVIITKGMSEEEIMLLSDLLDKIVNNYESAVNEDA
ncbi:MAG: MarR family winged helix-turn-helix transcriptional regulator [Eubacterium sp.]